MKQIFFPDFKIKPQILSQKIKFKDLKLDFLDLTENKKALKVEMNKDLMSDPDIVFVQLSYTIIRKFEDIKLSLAKTEEYKYAIQANIKQSIEILDHLTNILNLVKRNVKDQYLKLILKNEKKGNLERIPEEKNNLGDEVSIEGDVSFSKGFVKELDLVLFNRNSNTSSNQLSDNENILIRLKSVLTNKINKEFKKIKDVKQTKSLKNFIDSRVQSYNNNNEYLDSQSKSLIQEELSINNIVLKEEFNYLDKNSLNLIGNKSKYAFELLSYLKNLKIKKIKT